MAVADVTLTALSLDAGPISPGFSPGRRAYALRVPHSVATTRVSWKCADPAATVAVALGTGAASLGAPPVGATATPAADGAAADATLALPVGRSVVAVDVTAADGRGRQRTTVTVVRAPALPDWERVLSAAPWRPRDSAGELVHDGRMWLFGGYLPELVGDVWASDDGIAWEGVGQIPTAAGVNIPAAWSHEGRMWVTTHDGQLWASADGRDWELVNPAPPWGGRYAVGAAVFAGRMWAAGGMAAGVPYNDVWSSTDGITWTLECAAAPWSRRQLFSMLVAHDGALWVLGGGLTVYHPFRAYTDVWRSTDGRTWTQVTSAAPWPGRIWSSAVSWAGRLWVLGGFRAEPAWQNFDDVWYSADGAQWHRLETEHRWSARHEMSLYVHDGALWLAGGNAWPLCNDVWRLQIAGPTFVTVPVVEEFCTARYAYAARADFHAGGGPLRYRLVEAPAWLAVEAETGRVSGEAPATPGVFAVELEARDAAGTTARQAWEVHVIPAG